MAFLCTFSGLLAAGVIWMALFVEFGDAASPTLKSLAVWLSPMEISGWCFYLALSFVCCWLAFRMVRSRLGSAPPNDGDS